jgi:hypothetical protein
MRLVLIRTFPLGWLAHRGVVLLFRYPASFKLMPHPHPHPPIHTSHPHSSPCLFRALLASQVWMSPDALKQCPETAPSLPVSGRAALAVSVLERFISLKGCPTTPSSLYFSEIAPLLGRAVKGVLWYQGEANANDPYNYGHCLLPSMINDWRASWAAVGADPQLPFLFVQVRVTRKRPHFFLALQRVRAHRSFHEMRGKGRL